MFLKCILIGLFVVFAGCGFIDESRKPISEIRSIDLSDIEIGEPFGIVTDGAHIFFTDGLSGKIWMAESNGEFRVFSEEFQTPSHLVLGSDGELFVADSGDHTIKRVDADGRVSVVAGVSGTSGLLDGTAMESLFNAPIGIAYSKGRIFVSDTYNDRIRMIKDGIVSTIAGGEQGLFDADSGAAARFDTPTGLVFLDDSLIVADTGNRRLRAVNVETGETVTIAGGGPQDSPDGIPGKAAFIEPVALAIGPSGAIYVADGNRIRVIGRRVFPLVETLSGGRRGYIDKPLLISKFNRISGLAFTSNGDLLIADSDNRAVRVATSGTTGNALTAEEISARKTTARDFREKAEGRWPYKNAGRTREIAGTLGEVRGEIEDSESYAGFHNGLDIVGGYGEEARMVRTEKILRPRAVGEFSTLRENVRFPDLGYIHLRLGRDADEKRFEDKRFLFQTDRNGNLKGLRIPRGTSFKAGESIGTLNAMNHVHLIAGPAGNEMNALAALRLPGVGDSRVPVINDIELFDRDWNKLENGAGPEQTIVGSQFRVVVNAYDQMDGNAARRRLGLFKLGYKILNRKGIPLEGFEEPNWTIDFSMFPEASANAVYAPGSKSGATGTTIFKYIVSNELSGTEFREGFVKLPRKNENYLLRVFAADYFGNIATKDVSVVFE